MNGKWTRPALGSVVILGLIGAVSAPAAANETSATTSIVVQLTDPESSRPVVGAIANLGGTVERQLPIVAGFAATVPAAAVPVLTRMAGVRAVTPDVELHLLSHDGEGGGQGTGSAASERSGGRVVSMASAIDDTGASAYLASGLTGRGIDVALVDSGVALVPGLDGDGKVVDGPDLSGEAHDVELAHRDHFGHGTHMAGIIAGADQRRADGFSGLAPDARIVNVKVANEFGTTNISTVIAGIGWAVSHRDRDGLNIKVLNLSFGTDGGADPGLDPLDQAVEQAWRSGLTVVVAAGNRGADLGHLSNPARDPLVLAVGAADSRGTRKPSDDITVDFSSRGDGSRNPDVVAPGRSIVSLRTPGSYIDENYEAARVGDRLFRGSGTSQSAAVTSGAVALVLEQHPDATPDQVKALLNSTAKMLTGGGDETAQGHGLLDLATALTTDLPAATTPAAGPGPDGHPLTLGQQDSVWHVSAFAGTAELSIDLIHARAAAAVHTDVVDGGWDGSSWSDGSWSGGSWSGGSWSGSSWSDESW
jgi:serine protease AprX